MKWFCFKFWFYWRLTLACLAHLNWTIALYTNCIFFTLWKSYDLLWFWMHLTLCSCFESLRRENYLLVWCNLIRHKREKYPDLTYKEIYLIVYGGHGTRAERKLENMENKENYERLTRRATRRDKKSRGEELSSSSDSEDEKPVQPVNGKKKTRRQEVEELEEHDAEKYLYVGTAVPSGNSLQRLEEGAEGDGNEFEMQDRRGNGEEEDRPSTSDPPSRPPRRRDGPRKPPTFSGGDSGDDSSGENVDEGTPLHRQKVVKGEHLHRKKDVSGRVNSGNEEREVDVKDRKRRKRLGRGERRNTFLSGGRAPMKAGMDDDSSSPRGDMIISDPTETASINSQTRWQRMKAFIPRHLPNFSRQTSAMDPNAIDIIAPNFKNNFDVLNAKESKRREHRDKKNLTKKLRARKKEELRVAAAAEKRRKKIADSIELFLQLLRMICSFATLVGNIRKVWGFAQFRYLKPGQHASDNPDLIFIFRCTTFLDCTMFLTNTLWAMCLQWHLCCRLGLFKFMAWSALLGFIAFIIMLLPMSMAMDQLDISWCRFGNHTSLYPYAPHW